MVLQQIVGALDSSAYGTVQGGVPETTALLNEKWDKIFYTGGAAVGTIIAKKAAETLTPVALELGGKNPAFVTRNADVRLAARRLLWAKLHNAGQVCISQNYILVDREVLPTLKAEIQTALKEFMPNGAKDNSDYSKIATPRQWSRLKKLLDDSRGSIVAGGNMDETTQFLEPTVVEVLDASDPLIQEETFGPIVTLLPVTSLDEAIRIANEVDATPLGAYPFGSKAETDKVLAELRSGGATVNDAFFHGAVPTLQFGGVGSSGQGAYRGRASFECFTHRRSIAKTPGWMEGLLNVRYPPYQGKLEQFQRMNNHKPDFDRDGNVKVGLIRYILCLGASSAQGGLVRYAVVLLGK
jgi:beta-apo-4'-carotenal oxygenase